METYREVAERTARYGDPEPDASSAVGAYQKREARIRYLERLERAVLSIPDAARREALLASARQEKERRFVGGPANGQTRSVPQDCLTYILASDNTVYDLVEVTIGVLTDMQFVPRV